MIRSENARPSVCVYIDFTGMAVGTYVEAASNLLGRGFTLRLGHSLVWSRQFE